MSTPAKTTSKESATSLGAQAIRAAVHFAGEVLNIAEIQFPLSALNRTCTIENLQRDVDAMQRLVTLLKSK